jgi:hypothetical protein
MSAMGVYLSIEKLEQRESEKPEQRESEKLEQRESEKLEHLPDRNPGAIGDSVSREFGLVKDASPDQKSGWRSCVVGPCGGVSQGVRRCTRAAGEDQSNAASGTSQV